jgi:hypothetical protein
MDKKSDIRSTREAFLNNDKSSEVPGALAKATMAIAINLLGVATGIGAVPIFGPLAVECFNLQIPNQKLIRVEKLLKILLSKVYNISQDEINQRFYTDEFLDLLQDCVFQSSRAISDQRLGYLASVLEKSLTDEQIKYNQKKRLLSILSELNDIEVIILQSYGFEPPNDYEFKNKHHSIFKNADLQYNPSEEEREENAMYVNYRDHLVNLGLIGPYTLGDSQPFLTQLGYMFLKILGCAETVKLEQVIGIAISPISAMQVAEEGFTKIEKESQVNIKTNDNPLGLSESQRQRELFRKTLQSFSHF